MYQKFRAWVAASAARTQALFAFFICTVATLVIGLFGMAFGAPWEYAGYTGQYVAVAFFYARAKNDVEVTYLSGNTSLTRQQVFFRYGWMPWKNTAVLKAELTASSYSITVFMVIWALLWFI